MIKDYGMDIQYHLRKANVVADALSRKRNENLPALITSEWHLLDDMRKLDLEIVTKKVGARLERLHIQPTLVDRIKSSQVDDSSRLEIKHRMEIGKAPKFYVDEDGIVRYKGRLCVPEQGELKRELLKEAHYSSYFIHPGGNKIYQDLKKLY